LWLKFGHFFVSAVLPILADFSPWSSEWHVLCVICGVDYSRYDVNHNFLKNINRIILEVHVGWGTPRMFGGLGNILYTQKRDIFGINNILGNMRYNMYLCCYEGNFDKQWDLLI